MLIGKRVGQLENGEKIFGKTSYGLNWRKLNYLILKTNNNKCQKDIF